MNLNKPLDEKALAVFRRFVEQHYAAWMDEYPDEFQLGTVVKLTLGELRAIRAYLSALSPVQAVAPEPVAEHKWFDPECGVNGCQSLVWKARYESAVKGRQEFRQAFREAKSAPTKDQALREALADLVSWFDGGPSSYGPWIIKAGPYGADEAVEAARAALTDGEK